MMPRKALRGGHASDTKRPPAALPQYDELLQQTREYNAGMKAAMAAPEVTLGSAYV